MEFDAKLLQQIILNLPNYIFWKDRDLIYRGCNYNFAKVAGFSSPADVIGKTDNDMPWKETTAHIYQAEDRQILETGRDILEKEVPMIIETSEERILSVSKVPLYSGENIVGILGIYTDITDRKKMEKLITKASNDILQANEKKRLFVHIVSLEIRNLLMGIETACQLPSQVELPAKASIAPMLMHESTTKILRIFEQVNKFLELKEPLNDDDEIQIHVICELVAEEGLNLLHQKPVVVIVDYDRELEDYQQGDRSKLFWILENLIINAANYTDRGLIKIMVSINEQTKFGYTLEITVTDTGCGISPESIGGLFDVFNRKTVEDSPYHSGGLILSITKMLADSLNGTLTVSSTEGKGSTFMLTLPFKKSKIHTSTASKYPSRTLQSIIFSDNSWFSAAIETFTPLKITASFKTDNVSSEDKMVEAVMPDDLVLFIDNAIGLEAMRKFSKRISVDLPNSHFFAVVVGANKLSDYTNLFPMTWTVVRLDMPITPDSFEKQFNLEYQKWENGQLPELNYLLNQRKIRVLIVEDNKIVRYALKFWLELLNCEVTEAHNGEAAVELVKNDTWQHYDIIFMDIGLPGITGLDVTMLLREHPIYKTIPIIGETAYVSGRDTSCCAEAGMTDVLFKPVKPDDIHRVLNLYVKKQVH